MRLDIAERRWLQISLGQCSAHEFNLGIGIRPGQAPAAAIVVEHGAADDRQNWIAVSDRFVQQFQREAEGPLAADVAVRRFAEAGDDAAARQGSCRSHDGVHVPVHEHIRTASERHPEFVGTQPGHRLADRGQTASAGGVKGDAGTAQVELLGDPVRDEREQ